MTPHEPDPPADPNPDPDPGPHREAADVGERLAGWIDDLGLTGHLGAAGLPVVHRTPDGRAVWIDPATGEPLAADDVARLDRELRRQGEDPQHAVPVALVRLRRLADLRDRLLASPCFTYDTLAAVRDASTEATRLEVVRAAAARRLLVVSAGERRLVPAFQLGEDGEPRPDLVPLVEPLLAAGMDPWRVWGWLTQPVALLGGLVPERAAADPQQADLARRAADRLAQRVAGRG